MHDNFMIAEYRRNKCLMHLPNELSSILGIKCFMNSVNISLGYGKLPLNEI